MMETRGGGGISGGGSAAGAGGGCGDASDLSKSGGPVNIPGGGARGSSTGSGGGGSSGGSAITAQRVSGYGILAAIGFFSLAAQTLLFRDFFTVFEQSELGVACFFCAWLLWTAAGAFVARARWSRLAASVDALSLLILLFVPAFLLQRMGIRGARAIAGVEAYEFFPLLRMAGIALLVNSPVSFLSGFFYTRACHAFSAAESIAPARVFIVEALGSFAGGIAVTLLLAGGAAEERIFLLTAGLLAGATALHRLRRGSLASGLVPLLAALLALGLGADRIWTERRDLEDWSRFLPAEALAGRFTTSQARYLFGEHRGQFHVVAGESIADAIPREESASRIISIHLAQNPQARRFLVIGPGGFSIARRLLDLPQAE
ncbi:MAG: hypothetical protein JXA90_05275, partial [Planctomycetes bacterium]|nr:hypothetical protein [Planctomycetota bacterium]